MSVLITKASWSRIAAAFWLTTCVCPLRAAVNPPDLKPYKEILKSELVVRGTSVAVEFKFETVVDAVPFFFHPNPTDSMLVGRVVMTVEEQLRGRIDEKTVEFIAYVSMTHHRDNYEVGQEMVVGLMWEADVLGGMYVMGSDARRFLLTPHGWAQQSSQLLLQDLAPLRSILARVAPTQLLADADAIVLADLVSEDNEDFWSPKGERYGVRTLHLDNVEVLKGGAVSTVKVISWGNYWPEWRDDPTSPRDLRPGERYCLFLRRSDNGFVILRGMSGVYEVRGDSLRLPNRKPLELTVGKLRALVQEQ